MKISLKLKRRWIFQLAAIGVLILISLLLPNLWKYSQSMSETKRENSSVEYVISIETSDKITDCTNKTVSTNSTNEMKVILLWTDFYRWPDYEFGLGQQPFVTAGCRFTNCMTTKNRSLVNQSQAIIFHPVDYKMDDFPSYRRSDQRYIFYFFESLTSYQNLPIFQNLSKRFFNWTMTYRRDSDIYSSQYYGTLKRKTTSKVANSLPILPGTLPLNSSISLNVEVNVTNRTKLVTWFNSHCSTPSQREIFFGEMAKHIPIDIYGKCGTLECLPWNSPECDKILMDYKYYVSAENNFCTDYVTEKFYKALEAGAVPIVYGGADYSAYAPPHSFINAMDFDSSEALANYLKLLDSNPRLYSRYLEWKNDWEVIRHPMDGWCDLCEKLNDPNQQSKIYIDIAKWWYEKFPCLPRKAILDRFNFS